MRLAIISDLHIGEKAREFDLRPNGVPPYSGHPGYLDHFREFVSEQNISADALIVSGDITDRAQPTQFVHASKVIKATAEALGVGSDHIFAVPGNHDLNWDISKLATEHGESFWHDFKFAPFARGHAELGCDESIAKKLIDAPHFVQRALPGADVWLFNSAAYDTPDRSPHRGEIREVHRASLRSALEAAYLGRSKDRVRIFLTHHHLKPQPELYPDVPDFSGMVNGDALLDLLYEFSFDLVLHGHKHRPWCRTLQEGGRDPIVIWCSGSFSQTLGPQYYGTIGNLWHLVEVDSGPGALEFFGKVKSWAFAPGQGWVPSRPAEHGIDHVTPFGLMATRTGLEAKLRERLAASSAPYIEWADIAQSDNILAYQPGTTIWPLLEAIVLDYGFRLHGNRDSLEGLILLKSSAKLGAGK